MTSNMDPRKDISNLNLDSPDLEIFSDIVPRDKSAQKKSSWKDLLNKTYTRTGLTISLLLFLFGSTFFIASRVKSPSFKTSSANVKYIPKAEINIPQTPKYKVCSETNFAPEEVSFLNSYCQGFFCQNHQDKEACESTDVLVIKGGFLSEETGQDGISDCLWLDEEASCEPKY
jgi:hypothetical protein